ncbi:dihydroorotate dehydrogenase electron transfer subunit [Desulfothermus okinawensis JCM 13304]
MHKNPSNRDQITCLDLKVLEVAPVGGEEFFILRLSSPKWNYKTGQFVMLRPHSWGYDPYLPRPFSISDMDDEKLEIFFQVVGKGTKKLSQLRPGDKVKVWGPLGNGFKIDKSLPILILAGGMGIAPFLGLIKKHPKPENIEIIFGHRKDISCYPLKNISKKILIWTIRDKNQRDLMRLKKAIQIKIEGYSSEGQIFACGPLPFLNMVHTVCSTKKTQLQISLERPMACGIGVCLGCSIPGPGDKNFQVCTHGPVFYCEELTNFCEHSTC